MSRKRAEFMRVLLEYPLWGMKALFAFLASVFGSLLFLYIYFLIDLFSSLYKKLQEDKDRDLAVEHFEASKKLQKDFDKIAKSQQKYERERETKEDSLKFLNKLMAEGLIREKDLLSLAGTSGYFQLFVYSASLRKLISTSDIENPRRLYPIFLEKLGFVRLGKNSTFFLLNKNRLENKELKSIKNMKKFLMYHFSKTRTKEWDDFLKLVGKIDRKKYLKLKNTSYKKEGYLKYNFLITETNMNPTNIGFVDGEYMGLGVVSRESAINSHILEKSNLGRIVINKQLKVKIRKIIEKLDISLLLDGVKIADKNIVDLKQDIIKEKLEVGNIIDFYKVNVADLASELVEIGLEKKKSNKIAKQIIKTTKAYKNALTELNIII